MKVEVLPLHRYTIGIFRYKLIPTKTKGGCRRKMFKNLKLRVKLIGGFSVIAFIVLVVGVSGYIGVSRIFGSLQEISGKYLPGMEALLVIKGAQTEINSVEKTLLIPELDETRLQAQYDRFQAAWKRADDGWKKYESFQHTTKEEALWKKFVPVWDQWKKDHERYIELYNKKDRAGNRLWREISNQTVSINQKSFEDAETTLSEIINLNSALAREFKKLSEEDVVRTKFLLVFAMVIGPVIALALGIFLSLSITKPIAQGVSFAEKVAEGELTHKLEVDQSDEIGILAKALDRITSNSLR